MKKKIIPIILITIFLAFLGAYTYLQFHYSVPILMYHSFDESLVGEYAAVAPDVFYNQMKFIKDKNYTVISLDDYCRMLKDKEKVPRNLIVITIDDGYRDNVEAIKTLQKFNFPATIFVIANNIGNERYLTREHIEWFLKNTQVHIGAHGVYSHYLPDVDDEVVNFEIVESKKRLENLFSVKVDTISYPTGGFDKRVLKEVRDAGYLCACTTNRGFSKELDIYALRRIKITNRDSGVRLWAKLSGFYNFFKRVKNPY